MLYKTYIRCEQYSRQTHPIDSGLLRIGSQPLADHNRSRIRMNEEETWCRFFSCQVVCDLFLGALQIEPTASADITRYGDNGLQGTILCCAGLLFDCSEQYKEKITKLDTLIIL